MIDSEHVSLFIITGGISHHTGSPTSPFIMYLIALPSTEAIWLTLLGYGCIFCVYP